jgi:NAD kinase
MKNFTLCFFVFLSTCVFAQPANDDCSGAISITTSTFATTCSSPISATTANATSSSPVPACSNATTADDDVWYSFTASSQSVVVRISNAVYVPSGTAIMSMELLFGSCGSLSSVTCLNGFVFGNGYQIINGLTIGTTYYLRFWTNNNTSDANFDFCVQNVSAPANDDCINAITFTTQPYGTTCTASVSGNSTGATPSTPTPACGVADANDDVWYKFTASSQSVILRFSNANITTTGGGAFFSYALYNGCPTTTAGIACNNGNLGFVNGYEIINGLTIGTTYYLRLFSYGGNNYMSFNFCVQDVPAPPSNDDCVNAITFSTQPYGTTCTASVSGNSTGATPSTPTPACGAGDANDDVWYKFTASSQSVILRFNNALITTTGGGAYFSYALYNGCPTTTAGIACNNGNLGFVNGYEIINGLTIGTTYYLRLFSYGGNNYMSFDFCVQNIVAPPANDDCVNAITFTTQPYGTTCAASVSGNTTGATPSTPTPACGGGDANDDVWYKFTASSQSVILRFNNATLTTTGGGAYFSYALYNGCPTTTAGITCNNGNLGFVNGYEIINGLTIGTTYYLRLFSYGGNNYMSFDFCVQNIVPPPANDDCVNAITFTTQPYGTTCTASVSGNTTGATPSTPTPACGGGDANDDVWYKFTASSQSVILRFNNALITTTGGGAYFSYALYNGCPTTTAGIACNNGNLGFVNGYEIINGLTIGTTYYLRLFSYGGNNYMSFDFCVQNVPPPPANDECIGAIAVPITSLGSGCVSPISANTTGATASTPATSCAGGDSNDDIWYSFVPNTSSVILNFSNAIITSTGGGSYLSYALYSSCPTTTATLFCGNGNIGFVNGTTTFAGLTAGNTYYLRLFSYGGNNYTSFNFCLQQPLLNDECIGAIDIPVSNGFCNNPIIGTLKNATTSAAFALPTCAGNDSKDVWFKATVPATGNLIIQTSAAVVVGANDLVMTAYSGVCGTLTQIACDDNGNPETAPSANHSRITLTGRTPGEVIIFRVNPFSSSSEEQFAICAWDETTTVLPAIAVGGTCVSGVIKTINNANGNTYMWVPVFNSNGEIIAEIYSNGNNLGNITSNVFVNTGTIRQDLAGLLYLDRNIALQVANQPSSNVRVRMYIKTAELAALQAADPSITSINSVDITKTSTACQPAFSGPGSAVPVTNAAYGTNYYIQATINSFSSFYVDKTSSVLPVKIVSFNGRLGIDKRINLFWQVETQLGITSYTIERSSDGIHFAAIGTVASNNNSSSSYNFTDDSPLAGKNYYQLRVIENGRESLSNIILITTSNKAEIIVYPNPVTSEGVLYITTNSKGGKFILESMSGQLLLQSNLQSGSNAINLSSLAKGIYIYKVHFTDSRINKTGKLVVQ